MLTLLQVVVELAQCVSAGTLPLSAVVTLLNRHRLEAYKHCEVFMLLRDWFVEILLEMEGLTTPVTVLKLLQSEFGTSAKQVQVSVTGTHQKLL